MEDKSLLCEREGLDVKVRKGRVEALTVMASDDAIYDSTVS